MVRTRSSGLGRLPVWVVRNRSLLRQDLIRGSGMTGARAMRVVPNDAVRAILGVAQNKDAGGGQ
jgi:hypothetical protein